MHKPNVARIGRGPAVDLGAVARTLMEQGFHPRDIRRVMTERTGRRQSYHYAGESNGVRVSVQGSREKERRLRQAKLCLNGCGKRWAPMATVCSDCLAKKWGAGETPVPEHLHV